MVPWDPYVSDEVPLASNARSMQQVLQNCKDATRHPVDVRPAEIDFWSNVVLAVLKAKNEIKNPRIRAEIGPKPKISLGK